MRKIIKVSQELQNSFSAGLDLYKIAQVSTLNDWQKVIAAVNAPVPDQIGEAARYLKLGAENMSANAVKFKHLSVEDLNTAIYMVANTSPEQMKSYLNKEAQLNSLWNGTKYIGKNTLRVLPVIGFVFSFLLALKNFTYGLATFAKLAKDSNQVGLTWLEVLYPSKLTEAVNNYQNNPNKLSILATLTKYSKEFSDEGISFVANAVDFVKDIIFLFLDVGSFGWLTVGDVSLSFVLMGIEYLVESQSLYMFDDVLTKINSIAQENIEKLTPAQQDTDFDTMDYDQMREWFTSRN